MDLKRFEPISKDILKKAIDPYIDDTMRGYESPINISENIANKIISERENSIVAQISSQIGVTVDKNELVKALSYDRDQYREGYTKGYQDAYYVGYEDACRFILGLLKEENKNE